MAWTCSLSHRERRSRPRERTSSRTCSPCREVSRPGRWSGRSLLRAHLTSTRTRSSFLVNGGPVQTPTTVSFDGVQNVVSGSELRAPSFLDPARRERRRDDRRRESATALRSIFRARSKRPDARRRDRPAPLRFARELAGDDYDSTALLIYVKTGFSRLLAPPEVSTRAPGPASRPNRGANTLPRASRSPVSDQHVELPGFRLERGMMPAPSDLGGETRRPVA